MVLVRCPKSPVGAKEQIYGISFAVYLAPIHPRSGPIFISGIDMLRLYSFEELKVQYSLEQNQKYAK